MKLSNKIELVTRIYLKCIIINMLTKIAGTLFFRDFSLHVTNFGREILITHGVLMSIENSA